MVWLKWILIAIAALLAIFFGVGMMLPGSYHVERSVEIEAPVASVHALVGDLRAWEEWTPWKEEDPTIETTFGATTAGVGAHQHWTGESGSGELTFTRCDPAAGVAYDLAFEQGKYRSIGEIRYEPAGDVTRVVWVMDGKNEGVLARWFGVMMDRMVGPMFEQGLGKLKAVVEKAA